MKLRNKIILIFGGTVTASIVAVGAYAYVSSSKIAMESIMQGIENSSILAAGQISGKIEDYMNTATVSGTDFVLSTQSTSTIAKVNRIDQLAEAYQFTSANILDKNGVSLKDQTDFSDREYVKNALAGKTNISDITLSKYTNTYGFSIAAPIRTTTGQIEGALYYRFDIDFMRDILDDIQMSEHSYAYIVDGDGTVIVHEDASLINEMNLTEQGGSLAQLEQAVAKNEEGITTYQYHGQNMLCGYCKIAGTDGWSLLLVAPESDFLKSVQDSMMKILWVDFVLIAIAVLIAISFAGMIGKSAVRVKDLLGKIAKGDFSSELQTIGKNDELSVLQDTSIELQNTFSKMIRETNSILGSITDYNLSIQDMGEYPGEFNQLSESVNAIKRMLKGIIADVQESAAAVGTGSGQLASAADALSQGTVSQASSIDKVVLDIQEVTERIQRNSENEVVVEDKLKNLDSLIGNGNSEMVKLVEIVKEVASMSTDIQKIVGTIDSIAFQTNILALNASVEAARAGENGKGFAVVADEVGNLAAKTSEASKQTAELISKCIGGINSAMTSANVTFECLNEIVGNSAEINKAFEEIASDTKEQSVKSASIRMEMNSISDVVQTNTATAQETAAATQELSDQANTLSFMIQKFTIR